MKTIRNLLTGSAALLVLAGAAQAGQSTAREREQTRQLNIQALQGAVGSGPVAQQSSSVIDAAAKLPANAPPAAAPTPAVQIADNQPMATTALGSLANPPDKLATAKVVDATGTVVGAVQKVDLDSSGKPTRVEIALLGSDRIVAIDPSGLSYDQANNVVSAALDKSQIVQLPPIG